MNPGTPAIVSKKITLLIHNLSDINLSYQGNILVYPLITSNPIRIDLTK